MLIANPWLIEMNGAKKWMKDKKEKVCMFVCVKCCANPSGELKLGGLIRLNLS